MPVLSAGGREYLYVVVDDYSQAVYTRPLRLKSEAVDTFKTFKAAAELESGKKLHEIMTDNTRELSMGEMREFCEEGIKLHTTVPYHPASNGVAERTIGILTNAARAMLHDSGLPRSLWAKGDLCEESDANEGTARMYPHSNLSTAHLPTSLTCARSAPHARLCSPRPN